MKLDLAKDLYRDSWNRRDQLTSGTGTPISVLTAVSGAIAVLLANFEYECGIRTLLFALAGLLSVAALGAAAYFLARSYHGYTYQEIPNAADLDAHCSALHAYHLANGGRPTEADADFDAYLASRFVEAADVNSRNNESKAAFLYRATQFLIGGIVFAALATVPWAHAKLDSAEEAQRVIIQSPVNVILPPGAPSAEPPVKKPAAADTSAASQSSASPSRASESAGEGGRTATSKAGPTSTKPPR